MKAGHRAVDNSVAGYGGQCSASSLRIGPHSRRTGEHRRTSRSGASFWSPRDRRHDPKGHVDQGIATGVPLEQPVDRPPMQAPERLGGMSPAQGGGAKGEREVPITHAEESGQFRPLTLPSVSCSGFCHRPVEWFLDHPSELQAMPSPRPFG